MVKKVAHLQLLPLLSGAQRVTLNEVSQIDNSKVEFSVIVSSTGPLTEELDKIGIRHFQIDDLVREISPAKDLMAIYSLYKHFKTETYDVVHTHSSKTGFVGRVAAKLAGVKTVIHTVHGFAFPSTSNIFTKGIYFLMEFIAARCTDHLIVLNSTDYSIAVNLLRLRKNRVKVIPNSVDIDKFNVVSKSPNSILRVVMVGRLWHQKNPLCLLKALAHVVKSGRSILVDIVGDGDLRSEIEIFVEDNNLQQHVRLLGWVDDVSYILPLYDIFVLPSLWEGLPLAILEAQACGLPAVVSNISGNRDLVTHGVNGFLFNKDDSKHLAEQLIAYCDDCNLVVNHSIGARNNAVDNYSYQQRNNKLLNLYSGVL